jgi:predicted O-methyltransferase YrrM
MYWENLEGQFTFQILYSNMVNKFNNAKFVEIGAWKGKSAVFMAEKIKESGKNIQFWSVDTFEGPLLEAKNIEPIKNFLHTIVGDSSKVHDQFEDESLDFVFIDGDHSYNGVKKDLKGWFPKIKNGGIIAGHDYFEPSCGVRQAVDEYFSFGAQPYEGGCWIFYK